MAGLDPSNPRYGPEKRTMPLFMTDEEYRSTHEYEEPETPQSDDPGTYTPHSVGGAILICMVDVIFTIFKFVLFLFI